MRAGPAALSRRPRAERDGRDGRGGENRGGCAATGWVGPTGTRRRV
jgi:hypothetical protein